MDLSKRQYLKAAGVSLTALSLGIEGTVASRSDTAGALGGGVQAQQNGNGGPDSGDRLDYETDDSGNVEFVYEGVDFETDGDDLELTAAGSIDSFEYKGDDLEWSGGDVHLEWEAGGEFEATRN